MTDILILPPEDLIFDSSITNRCFGSCTAWNDIGIQSGQGLREVGANIWSRYIGIKLNGPEKIDRQFELRQPYMRRWHILRWIRGQSLRKNKMMTMAHRAYVCPRPSQVERPAYAYSISNSLMWNTSHARRAACTVYCIKLNPTSHRRNRSLSCHQQTSATSGIKIARLQRNAWMGAKNLISYREANECNETCHRWDLPL